MDEITLMHVIRLETALNILHDVNPDYLRSGVVSKEDMAKVGLTESDLRLLARLLTDIKNLQRTMSLLQNENNKLIRKIKSAGMN